MNPTVWAALISAGIAATVSILIGVFETGHRIGQTEGTVNFLNNSWR